MITYVYTDYEDCGYITAGKLYEATLTSEGFGSFLDDEGEWLYENFNQGNHINNKPWSIHKSNYRVGDKVEDVCSEYVRFDGEDVDFGTVFFITPAGIDVQWDGLDYAWFCFEDDVKPYVMPVVEPEDDLMKPFAGSYGSFLVENPSEPFGWPSFAGLSDGKDPYLCCGTKDEWYSEDSTQDNVNSPSHYNTGGTIECIEYIKDFLTTEEYIGYLRGNIAKYLHRFPYKNGIEDVRKAQWYLSRLEEQLNDTTED